MNFWLTLPEIRCQACLLGWAFGPRKLMKNCHGDFIATHERPRDSQDWHGFPAHFAGNSLPVLSVPGFGAHSPQWFFDSVGMGLRPAKAHEKLPCCLHRHPRAPPRPSRLAWISGAFGRIVAAMPVCLRFRSPLPAVVFRLCPWFPSARG